MRVTKLRLKPSCSSKAPGPRGVVTRCAVAAVTAPESSVGGEVDRFVHILVAQARLATGIVTCSLALLALAALLPPGSALAQQVPPDGAVRITQQDFKKLVATNNVIIVDARASDSYRSGHIPGAILLPLEGLAIWPPQFGKVVDTLKAANKPVVTYCA